MEFKGTNERMGRKMFSKRINRNIMEFKVTFMTIISVWTIWINRNIMEFKGYSCLYARSFVSELIET